MVSLRDSASWRWPESDSCFAALSCAFAPAGWPGPGSGAHPLGAVAMAGGLGGRSAGAIAARAPLA